MGVVLVGVAVLELKSLQPDSLAFGDRCVLATGYRLGFSLQSAS